MNQLSIFDIEEPQQSEELKTMVQQTAPEPQETKQEANNAKPTYFIHYYIESMRRLDWMRAKDQDDARYKFEKANRKAEIIKIEKSSRDYDELEALS